MKTAIPLLCWFALAPLCWGQPYDVVLANGRVMDPESGLDAVRNVGIAGGSIAAISTSKLDGRTVIDASGLVVAPGFIDLHSHGQTPENYRFKARDGVTTALEMEVGVWPVAAWYKQREDRALINFGATAGHIPARIAVMHDPGKFLPRGQAANEAASPEQQKQILAHVRQGLEDGALGIGIGIAYVPKASRLEILDLFRLAAERERTCFVHMRQAGPLDLGVIDSVQEVLSDAAVTGGAVHIVHITSMAFRQTRECLAMIEGARQHGIDVTTEAYPYTAGMTGLETAIFDEGWQQRLGISYGDLQWVETGERLTAESFARYRQQGGFVILHSIPEEMVRVAMASPIVMVASDGEIENGKGHPRGAGTYARVLGRYVREEHVLPLMEALRKMSLLPAQRLETASPQMRRKGRIKVGADADIAVFDPERVTDRATFENPAQYSEGIPYVLVGGAFVVRDGKLVEGAAPGKAIRSIQ